MTNLNDERTRLEEAEIEYKKIIFAKDEHIIQISI